MWQMSQFSLPMGMTPVIISGLLQGFGLGCTQVSRFSRAVYDFGDEAVAAFEPRVDPEMRSEAKFERVRITYITRTPT
jgi:hypothetical protein